MTRRARRGSKNTGIISNIGFGELVFYGWFLLRNIITARDRGAEERGKLSKSGSRL